MPSNKPPEPRAESAPARDENDASGAQQRENENADAGGAAAPPSGERAPQQAPEQLTPAGPQRDGEPMAVDEAGGAGGAGAPAAVPVVPPPPDSGEKDQTLEWRLDVAALHAARAKTDDRSYLSPPQAMHGVEYQLFVFPGTRNPREFGVFLKRSDRAIVQNWSVTAAFRFTLVNVKDASKSKDMTEEAPKVWDHVHNDWGFWHFNVDADLVLDEKEGYNENGFITVRTRQIRVDKPRTLALGVYSSRKETGLAGLENQGATCYLNSLLQSLFHLPAFRRAVYNMKVDLTTPPTKSVPFAMQRLFYHLEKSDVAQTKELTKSFGWNSFEAFTQHDVQEMLRVLTDKLEEKMKEQGMAGQIQGLFRGELLNYIECIKVDCVSQRFEHFYDLALNVAGCTDLYASIDKFIEVEILDGVNKYRSDQYGLQDARRGIRLHRLPPVLHIQLKRFEYDPFTDSTRKVNTRHEFPAVLDLDKYIDPAQPRPSTGRFVYDLFGVLVHSGDVGGGHYYAYIRPSAANHEWFRFDDDKITHATMDDALEGNYGGPMASLFGGYRDASALRKNSAYMLVYVMQSEVPNVMRPLSAEELPQHVAAMVDREREEAAKRAEEAMQAHLYVNVAIVTLADMRLAVDGIDMVRQKPALFVRIERAAPFYKLKLQAAKLLNVAPESFLLWKTQLNNYHSVRIDELVGVDWYNKSCDAVLGHAEPLPNALFTYGLVATMLDDVHVMSTLLSEPLPPPTVVIVAPAPTSTTPSDAAHAASGAGEAAGSTGSAAAAGSAGSSAAAGSAAAAPAAGSAGSAAPAEETLAAPPEYVEPREMYRCFSNNSVLVVVKRFDADEFVGILRTQAFALLDTRHNIGASLPTVMAAAGITPPGPAAEGEQGKPPVWLFDEKHWKSSVMGFINNGKNKVDEPISKVEAGDLWIVQVPPPPNAMAELLKEDSVIPSPTNDEEFSRLLKLVRAPSVFQYFKFLRQRQYIKLSPYSPDGVDVLPPIEVAVNDNWPIDVITSLLCAAYDGAVVNWQRDSARELEAAEKAAAVADADDAHANAALREAKARVAAAKARSAAGSLRPSLLRLHEIQHTNPLKIVALSVASESKAIHATLLFSSSNHHLMYERMPMSRAEMLGCFDAKVTVGSLRGGPATEIRVFVPKKGVVSDLCRIVVAEWVKLDKSLDVSAATPPPTASQLAVPASNDRPVSPALRALSPGADDDDAEIVDDDDTRPSLEHITCWKVASSSNRVGDQLELNTPLDSDLVPLAKRWAGDLMLLPLSRRDAAAINAQATLAEDVRAKLVQVWLIEVDTMITVESTLLFLVTPTTTFAELRERLRRRLRASRASFNEYRIGVVNANGVWLTPNNIRWLGGEPPAPPRKEDEDVVPSAAASAPTAGATAGTGAGAADVAATVVPAHASAVHDADPVRALLGAGGHLCVLRPRHAIAKRRKYQPVQKAIKIYG